jgi:hypothetical protein
VPDALDIAALDFTRYCLKQPDSFIGERFHELQVRPNGFCSGPESFADCESLECDDLRLVLPLVAHWCSLNDVLLEIICSSSLHYECRFTERYGDGQNVAQIIETGGSGDLCLQLFSGAAYLAERMKTVNEPQPSMSRSEFIKDSKKE